MATIKIRNVNYVRTGYEKEDVERREFLGVIFDLDESNNVVKEQHFNENEELENYTLNEYEQNLLLSTAQFDGDGNLLLRTVNTYDSDNQIVKKVNEYGEMGIEETFDYEYADGLLRKELLVDVDAGVRVTVKEYFYESPVAPDLMSKRVEYDEDGEVQYVHLMEYDDKRQLVQHTVDEVMAKDRRTFVFQYDERGNRVKELTYNYDEELIAKKYCSFNADNQILEEEIEDLDHYKRTVYEYQNGRLIKVSVLAKDDSLQSWTDLRYDEQNRLSASADYIIDEVDATEFRLLAEIYRIFE